jgi:sRNA-binding protein
MLPRKSEEGTISCEESVCRKRVRAEEKHRKGTAWRKIECIQSGACSVSIQRHSLRKIEKTNAEEKERAIENQREQAQDREDESNAFSWKHKHSASMQRHSLRTRKREQKRNSESKHRTERRGRMHSVGSQRDERSLLSVHSATRSQEGKVQVEEK